MSVIRVKFPDGWVAVPRTPEDFASWSAEISSRTKADHVILRDLSRLKKRIECQRPGKQWIAICPHDGAPRVAGLGSIAVWNSVLDSNVARMPSVRAGTQVRSASAITKSVGQSLVLDERRIDERRRGFGIVGLHRLIAAESDSALGSRIVEWLVVAACDSRTGLTMEFEMTTTDMTLFDNLVETSVKFLSNIDLREAI